MHPARVSATTRSSASSAPALELDPGFAPAWAGVAACHFTRAVLGTAPPAEAAAQAHAAANRALALEIDPGLSSAWHALGRVYYCTERHALAQEAMLKARSLDPLSMIIHTAVGDAFYYAREYEKSVEYYRGAIALDPRFDGAHTDLARSLEALGRIDEAKAEYEEGRRLSGGVAGPSFGLAHLEASRGNTKAARAMLAELTAVRSKRVVSAWGIAAVHASLGDADDAFRWLETAVEEHATGLVFLRVHPRLDPIRTDPRYAALVRRLGLDDRGSSHS